VNEGSWTRTGKKGECLGRLVCECRADGDWGACQRVAFPKEGCFNWRRPREGGLGLGVFFCGGGGCEGGGGGFGGGFLVFFLLVAAPRIGPLPLGFARACSLASACFPSLCTG